MGFVALFQLEYGLAGNVQKKRSFGIGFFGIFFGDFPIGRRLLPLFDGMTFETIALFRQRDGGLFIGGLSLHWQDIKNQEEWQGKPKDSTSFSLAMPCDTKNIRGQEN